MPLSKILFSTEGRIPRSTYWLYSFGYVGVLIVAFLVDYMFGTIDPDSGYGLFSGLLTLVGIYTSLAVSIKRCHDRNHSGWFLLASFIPFLGIWVGIELAFLRGTVGDNQYGPDPSEGYVPTSYSFETARRVKCPYCAELIMPDAIICRYCGRDLLKDGTNPKNESASSNRSEGDGKLYGTGVSKASRESGLKTCLKCLHSNPKEAVTCEHCGERFVPKDSTQIFRDRGWGDNIPRIGEHDGNISDVGESGGKPSYLSTSSNPKAKEDKTCFKCLHSNPRAARTCEHCGAKFLNISD